MNNKQVRTLRVAAIAGGLAVILGAFGAHGLKERLTADLLTIYETGVQYHFYHALALLALALATERIWQTVWAWRAAMCWIAGILVFSGSLYLLAITGLRWLGAITPIGGVAFILGWFCLLFTLPPLRQASGSKS